MNELIKNKRQCITWLVMYCVTIFASIMLFVLGYLFYQKGLAMNGAGEIIYKFDKNNPPPVITIMSFSILILLAVAVILGIVSFVYYIIIIVNFNKAPDNKNNTIFIFLIIGIFINLLGLVSVCLALSYYSKEIKNYQPQIKDYNYRDDEENY